MKVQLYTKRIWAFIFVACCLIGLYLSSKATFKSNKITLSPTYKVGYHADYSDTLVPDLYSNADLVVFGTYQGDLACAAVGGSRIETTGQFNVMQVMKGNCALGNIEIVFNGGTVSLSEYLQFMSESQIEKYGFDSPEFQSQVESISMEGDSLANMEVGKTYVIFINYNEANEKYYVMSDAYGARETNNDGGLYNPDTHSFMYA